MFFFYVFKCYTYYSSYYFILLLPRYVKDAKMMVRRKQIFVYLLERIERETGGKVTIVFDCQGAGVR